MNVIVNSVRVWHMPLDAGDIISVRATTATGRKARFDFYATDTDLRTLVDQGLETQEPVDIPENTGLFGEFFPTFG